MPDRFKMIPDYEVKIRVSMLAEREDYNIQMMNIPEMWKSTKGKGVKLAILDTGLPKHVDLSPAGGISFVDDYLEDRNGHSTHCGGIVAAVLGNGVGVAGIAPEVDDWYGAVLDGGGSGDIETIVRGIRWATDTLGADVISMSLGIAAGAPLFKALEAACNYAVGQGTAVFAAAGNESGDVGQPAIYDSVIAVAAVNSRQEHAAFSNSGKEVDFAAGGVDVYSTYLNNSYAVLSGTSMACPALAAVGALILAKHKDAGQRLTPAELYAHLQRIAYNVNGDGFDAVYGYGIPIFQPNGDEPVNTPIQPVRTPKKRHTLIASVSEDCEVWQLWNVFITNTMLHKAAGKSMDDAMAEGFRCAYAKTKEINDNLLRSK